MSNYDGKLGEWLKYLRRQVEAVERPQAEPEEEREPEKPTAHEPQAREVSRGEDRVVIRERLGRVMPSDLDDVEETSVIADSSLAEDRPRLSDRRPGVFEDADVPEVEDYLPFLKDRDRKVPGGPVAEPPPGQAEPPAEPEPSTGQASLFVPEWTGEPRPVIRTPEEPQTPQPDLAEGYAGPASEIATPPGAASMPEPRPQFVHREVAPPAGSGEEVRSMWDKLPRHIQLLVGQPPSEVAQRSYSVFKETREQLIARLLDPTLSLEEAARILNVCPTTVRRYTNRSLLRHFRTVGNQRRFRLSDVLAFLESSSNPPRSAEEHPS